MDFIALNIKVSPIEPWTEILIAELSEIGFDTFEETEFGVNAFIEEQHFSEESLKKINYLYNIPEGVDITFETKIIKRINWNEEWEKNYKPVIVGEKCYIRTEFHPSKPEFLYEIVIQPKMSFGTGHHETTNLVTEYLLEMDVEDLSVLDAGCGTGILGILASMKGAEKVYGYDIDQWAVENSLENAERNNIENISFEKGEVDLIKEKKYDLIVANINKNVLLNDIPFFSQSLKAEGILILSGFYKKDEEDLIDLCSKNSLVLTQKKNKDDWSCLKFSFKE